MYSWNGISSWDVIYLKNKNYTILYSMQVDKYVYNAR